MENTFICLTSFRRILRIANIAEEQLEDELQVQVTTQQPTSLYVVRCTRNLAMPSVIPSIFLLLHLFWFMQDTGYGFF